MIEIKKETVINVKGSNGEFLEKGKTYIYSDDKSAYIGKFEGLTHKGALMFSLDYKNIKVKHNIMAKSISYIYEFESEAI